MRKLINYIRSCFCRHEWELLNRAEIYEDAKNTMPKGMKWTYRCKKCGYFHTYKNY